MQKALPGVTRVGVLASPLDPRAHSASRWPSAAPGRPLLVHQAQIAALGAKARLPVVSAWREFPSSGGLLSYGTNVSAKFRRAPSCVDRILKGASPGDLPIEQATVFELVVNLKTARALGVTVPAELLAGADRLIE